MLDIPSMTSPLLFLRLLLVAEFTALVGSFRVRNLFAIFATWTDSLDFLLLCSFARYNAQISGAALPRPTAFVC